jgi:hypothetical protein
VAKGNFKEDWLQEQVKREAASEAASKSYFLLCIHFLFQPIVAAATAFSISWADVEPGTRPFKMDFSVLASAFPGIANPGAEGILMIALSFSSLN